MFSLAPGQLWLFTWLSSKWEYERTSSQRFTITDGILIAQGSKGVAARKADNGELLWILKAESEYGDADPVIFQQMVIVSSVKDRSVFALDLKTGTELWRIKSS